MANQEHFDNLKQGATTWNQWRQDHRDIQPDLSGVKLINADLSYADLHGANLTRSTFEGTQFARDNMSKTNMSNSNLKGVIFAVSDLSTAALSGGGLKRGNGYGCIDPSGMVAPFRAMAFVSCSLVTSAPLKLALLRSDSYRN